MERIDVAILAVGVVVLAASIVGVIAYEPGDGTDFQVTYQASDETDLPAPDDRSGGAQTFTFEVPVDRNRLVDLHFDVAVSTGQARVTDDQVDVTVTGPGDRSDDASFSVAASPTGGSNEVRLSFHIRDVPSATVVNADDEDSARTAALDEVNWTDGTGTWTVEVTVTAGTSAPGPGSPQYTVSVQPVAQVVAVAAIGPDVPDVRG